MSGAYRQFVYPLNVFMHVLTREGGPVEALHYGLFESADEPLAVAQERSTALLLARLPAAPARLLDVGIGLGTLLRRLTAMGHDAEGMTPDAQQLAIARARHGDRLKATCGRFEDFDADAGTSFDVLVFQESSQYIDSGALFRKAGALASRVLVLDEFALQPVDVPGALRTRGDFLAAATAAGFQVAEEVDLSEKAAPTVDYFLTRLPRHRDALAADLGLSHSQIDTLIESGHGYREHYRRGIYAYRMLDLRKPASARTNGRPSTLGTRIAGSWIADPFLQAADDGRIDHPIAGRSLRPGDPGHAALTSLRSVGAANGITPAERTSLARDGWLVEPHPDLARRSRLRVVTIETHTACNQECYFCPVSESPRDDRQMPDALFDDIVRQLGAFRGTLEGVFLSGYNEPTADPLFVDRCARLMTAGLPVAVNTNATGLTPTRVDRLGAVGRLRLLFVNLSTLDRDRYARDRGRDHLDLVLRNLDYAGARPVATEMVIVVLGIGDAAHRDDFEALRARFAGSQFDVRLHEVMDRAGLLPIGLKPAASASQPLAGGPPHAPAETPAGARPATSSRLGGCENLGSRPLQHLHVTADGRCVFCCEDYDERYIVGDLRTTTIEDVLRGDELARLRRWSYGLEEAPDDFICRRCIFALRR